MTSLPAIDIAGLSHCYGRHRALDDLSLTVAEQEIFGLLGPNGGGKTTLFRILTTLLPVQQGRVSILGFDVAAAPNAVREQIGVTFQSPSLDGRLTVQENLACQGRLYGLRGKTLEQRIGDLLTRLGLAERRRQRADTLSGGLKRRVEIAKGLLHSPSVLMLDEPSTGLDPGARHDLWRYLTELRREAAVTILVTTHLMDEAERCDRLAILDRGRLVAAGSPEELRASIGGDCLTIHARQLDELAEKIAQTFGLAPRKFSGFLRLEHPRGHELLRQIMDAFPNDIQSIALGKPTLEDVFIDRTGRQFWEASGASQPDAEIPAPS